VLIHKQSAIAGRGFRHIAVGAVGHNHDVHFAWAIASRTSKHDVGVRVCVCVATVGRPSVVAVHASGCGGEALLVQHSWADETVCKRVTTVLVVEAKQAQGNGGDRHLSKAR
jgi:hypothetical protein